MTARHVVPAIPSVHPALRFAAPLAGLQHAGRAPAERGDRAPAGGDAPERPLHIGVNTLFLIPREVGGTETYLVQTLSAMLQGSEVHFTLFTNRENDALLQSLYPKHARVRFCLLNFAASNRTRRIIREQTELPRRVRQAGVDLLWSPGYTAPLLLSVPQVVTIHDMQYQRYPQDLTWVARMATHVLVRSAARRADAVLCVSNFAKSEIVRFTAAAASKVHVTHEAADHCIPGPMAAAQVKQAVGRLVPGGRPYVLCVANSYPHKNIPVLVRAFAEISDLLPHALVLVGQPRLGEPEVQRAARELRVPERLIRLNYVASSDLVALYQGADAFVLPSLYEGFGLPILEAMIAGVPVVTTRCGSIPEVAGAHAAYFDAGSPQGLAEAIRALLRLSPHERQLRVRDAREWALGFSWAKTGAATLQCFERVLHEAGSRRS